MGLAENHLDVIASNSAIAGRENQKFTKGLVHEYQDIFQGIGKLTDVKTETLCSARRQSSHPKAKTNIHPLEGQIGQMLKRWEEMDIIEDVGDEPTWYSNVVLTPKRDGDSIRASLGMTKAIHFIKKTRHLSHLEGAGN